MLAVIANTVPVTDALGLMAVPAIASNFWMMFEEKRLAEATQRFWPLAVTLPIGLVIGALIVKSIPTDVLLIYVGTAVILLGAISVAGPKITMSPGLERQGGLATGLIAGILGGTTTVFGPPIVIFLNALRVERPVFITALGALWTYAAIVMLLVFGATRIVTWPIFALSVLTVVPVWAGYQAGLFVRRRIDDKRFRQFVLAGLLIGGARMILQGLA